MDDEEQVDGYKRERGWDTKIVAREGSGDWRHDLDSVCCPVVWRCLRPSVPCIRVSGTMSKPVSMSAAAVRLRCRGVWPMTEYGAVRFETARLGALAPKWRCKGAKHGGQTRPTGQAKHSVEPHITWSPGWQGRAIGQLGNWASAQRDTRWGIWEGNWNVGGPP